MDLQVPGDMAATMKQVAGRLRSPVSASSSPMEVDTNLIEAALLWRRAMDRFGTACLENIDLSRLPSHRDRMKEFAGALMERGGRDGFAMGRRLQALAEAL
ncbi:MAG: hypothetical protein FJX54_23780 [Alphaproteobacteria bacterium]|nr:hypothetical protein [Alphaproteobacteria bacterium]